MSQRIAFVAPSRFLGRSWWHYLVPRRITLDLPDRPAIYRWLCFNVTTKAAVSQPGSGA